jgi:hypothetical protein
VCGGAYPRAVTARVQGEPPPDAGPLSFVLSFLVVPIGACAAIVLHTPRLHRAETAMQAALVVGSMIVGAVWSYFSRSMAAVVGKATAVGTLALCLVVRMMPAADAQGDDTMPMFLQLVALAAIMAGAVLGLVSGTVALVAMSVRQRPRVAWLRGVMSVGHEYYGVVPLKRDDREKPLFLRYREGDLGLCAYRPPNDYRDVVAAEIVARVPRLF